MGREATRLFGADRVYTSSVSKAEVRKAMKKSVGIILAAVLSLGALTAVGAEVAEHHRRGGRMGMHGMFMGKELENKLNLTAEQKQKVEAMHQRQREQMKSQ